MPGHAGNTFIVTCKDCGAQWGKHWPCQGTEEEIRFGEHQCVVCFHEQYEKSMEEATKDIPENCGRPNCPLNGQKHVHALPVKNLEYDPKDREGY